MAQVLAKQVSSSAQQTNTATESRQPAATAIALNSDARDAVRREVGARNLGQEPKAQAVDPGTFSKMTLEELTKVSFEQIAKGGLKYVTASDRQAIDTAYSMHAQAIAAKVTAGLTQDQSTRIAQISQGYTAMTPQQIEQWKKELEGSNKPETTSAPAASSAVAPAPKVAETPKVVDAPKPAETAPNQQAKTQSAEGARTLDQLRSITAGDVMAKAFEEQRVKKIDLDTAVNQVMASVVREAFNSGDQQAKSNALRVQQGVIADLKDINGDVQGQASTAKTQAEPAKADTKPVQAAPIATEVAKSTAAPAAVSAKSAESSTGATETTKQDTRVDLSNSAQQNRERAAQQIQGILRGNAEAIRLGYSNGEDARSEIKTVAKLAVGRDESAGFIREQVKGFLSDYTKTAREKGSAVDAAVTLTRARELGAKFGIKELDKSIEQELSTRAKSDLGDLKKQIAGYVGTMQVTDLGRDGKLLMDRMLKDRPAEIQAEMRKELAKEFIAESLKQKLKSDMKGSEAKTVGDYVEDFAYKNDISKREMQAIATPIIKAVFKVSGKDSRETSLALTGLHVELKYQDTKDFELLRHRDALSGQVAAVGAKEAIDGLKSLVKGQTGDARALRDAANSYIAAQGRGLDDLAAETLKQDLAKEFVTEALKARLKPDMRPEDARFLANMVEDVASKFGLSKTRMQEAAEPVVFGTFHEPGPVFERTVMKLDAIASELKYGDTGRTGIAEHKKALAKENYDSLLKDRPTYGIDLRLEELRIAGRTAGLSLDQQGKDLAAYINSDLKAVITEVMNSKLDTKSAITELKKIRAEYLKLGSGQRSAFDAEVTKVVEGFDGRGATAAAKGGRILIGMDIE